LIEATKGSVTFITWNWRLHRPPFMPAMHEMSFLPPPGWSIAPMKIRSRMFLNSPGLSRLYMPLYSMSWRTISIVIWSPQSLYAGIEMSSMKTSIFLLPGGPKFLPERFSTEFSIWRWKMVGVVADEKDIFLTMKTFLSWRPRYWSTVLVLAVPGPPMKSTERSCWIERPIVYSLRVESTVGMSSEANAPLTVKPGVISHLGINVTQWTQSPVESSTLNS